MSLRLRQAIPGRPRRDSPSALSAITTPCGSYFVYPSSSNVVLLDPDGDLHNTLPFWDALPHRAGPSGIERDVGGVLARDGMVLAWSGAHVVLWNYQPQGWKVHSTIVANSPVASLDFWGGTLALGTQTGVELWRTENAEIVVWDRIWTGHSEPSPMVALPPEKSHIAWYFQGGREITIQAFGTKGVTGSPQILRQPRQIEWLGWRTVETTEAQLYVVTTNGVLRIYATVLDDPTWFQMLYAMDYRAFRDAGVLPPKGKGPAEFGTILVPDGATLRKAAKRAHVAAGNGRLSASVIKILDALDNDEADVAIWFGASGEVVLRSILNLDRAPPTLIKSEPLASFITPINASWSSRGCLLDGKSLFLAFPPTHAQPDVSTVRVSLLDLFGGNDESFGAAESADFETMSVLMTQDIQCFARTPNGRGLLAIGKGGEIGVWEKRRLGNMSWNESKLKTPALVGKGQWMAPASPILYAIYAKGRGIASYYHDPTDGPRVVLRHLDPGVGMPTEPVVMPHFTPKPDDKIELLLALSDIDDGYSPRRRRTRRAVIMAVSASGEAWVWRIEPAPTSPRFEFSESPLTRRDSFASTPRRRGTMLPDSPSGSPQVKGSIMSGDSGTGGYVYHSEKPIVTLISHSFLPVEDGKKPRFILPVDPMGWHSSTIDWETDTPLQDMVVTLSDSGVLEFWTPRLGQHLAGQRRSSVHRDACFDGHTANAGWTRTSVVRTEKTDVCLARTSSRKKTAIVCAVGDKYEVTIWDSNVSEFSTGLELTHTFDRGHVIQDLDWTTTSDLQSVLAVGFPHQIVLVCEQRLSYVDVTPGWAPFLHVDMRKYTSVPINDSVWIAGGSLAVAAGNQVYIFSRFLEKPTPPPSPPESDEVTHAKAELDGEEPEDIFQLIAHENGPLFDFHPTMLHQCLMWDKIDLVKNILVTLVKDMRKCEDEGRRRLIYQRLDPLAFHQSNAVRQQKVTKTDYSSLFSIVPSEDPTDDDEFTESVVQDLIERLDGPVVIPLDQVEKSSLAALAQAVLEVEASRRSLDICGLRYLISIRAFANRDRRTALSGAATPLPIPIPEEGLRPTAHSRISFRNIVWATHSESQVVLLQAATASTENNKMMWEDAKRLGVFLWLRNQEEIRAELEVVARNRFMAEEDRDPISASLFFFALGKKQVVHGLWRQAPGHREQAMMLKFLANDFSLDRWKTAAAKNAYALLSKQRYEYAAAFFMLAGSPKDAITVCLRQLNDWQLAVTLARAVEGDGPLLTWVLTDTVLPIAFAGGHRWLASWALWMLKRRDLSVRVIVSPMEEVAAAWNAEAVNSGKLVVGQPDNDDPSLLLLFQHLKSKTLQTAKGTSEITPVLEFDFVVHNARVFFRMGCHPLGLDVLRSWSFERAWFPPPVIKKRPEPIKVGGDVGKGPVSPTRRMSMSPYVVRRRSSFMLSRPAGRENMLMDMDVVAEGTEPPTRQPSPGPENGGLPSLTMSKMEDRAEPPGLMKGLRKDVEQGGAVFDMDQFFAPDKAKDVPELVTSPPSTNGSTTPALMTGQATPVFGVQFTDSFGGGAATALKPESVSPGSPSSRAASPGSKSPIGRTQRDRSPARSGTGTPSRKGANLMKEMMAGTQAEQGGVEFSLDSFFPGAPAPRATKAPTNVDTPKEEVKAKEDEHEDNVEKKDEPRKGLSLMKENNAHTHSAQGGVEFSLDSFAPTMPAPAPVAQDAYKMDATSNGETPDKTMEEKEERPKGLSLMKETNAHTLSAQGATEFSFDGFFPSEPVLPKSKPAQAPTPPDELKAAEATVNTKPVTPEPDSKPTGSPSPSTPESDTPKTTDADTLPNTSGKGTDTTPATPDPEPRKGANLMKDLNPNATAAQGGAEFNFGDFGF
ncbi:hypothetical protein CcaverHIS002_0204280 [Cutaneotrichosporon cavernicola]|uniref:RAVE complex protein Rav1 C-terminal domain-containing protein n=1 Tax=Cutaneotrichosporon cavernicola TaxID=279322 RepID=A0AA48L2J1_9TREE|nr:uncharacterized protein CcaverHIS019_0204250 [Cutaneotrichosporon cavernicola]BEI81268.1 hypothetical protein CcaverHIS002_0204280 [Cutaneotrichosporon cavernicola]BEI89063.1 hypothetical protein CcaverHIS019_0204250 [Cutaneotrichosporon cavernicola]